MMAYDLGVLYWFGSLHTPWLDAIVHGVTRLGNVVELGWITVALVLGLFWLKQRRFALGLALVALVAFGVQMGVKALVQRPRPDVAWRQIRLPDEPSFPSGHATCSMAIYTAAGILYGRRLGRRWLGMAGVFLGLAIGLTRPYLGVHYPLDVTIGWLGGLGVALVGTAAYLAARNASTSSRVGNAPVPPAG
ncbi:MAG: phosphatase PAP2 family protein [Gemmataceae bacterium]